MTARSSWQQVPSCRDLRSSFSADGPVKPPYAVYFQGGLTFEHAKLGVLMSLQKLVEKNLVTLACKIKQGPRFSEKELFMDKKRQVIIVGGGASGLTAGIMAARNGATVTILEQNEKPGRKICVTGNGRCNLTNQDMSWKYSHGEHPEFAKKILAQFSLEDTLKIF